MGVETLKPVMASSGPELDFVFDNGNGLGQIEQSEA